MKKIIKDYYFVFPKKTRTSILLLLLLLTLTILVWVLLPYFVPYDDSVLKDSIALQKQWEEHQSLNEKEDVESNFVISPNLKINPNSASVEDMMSIGIPKGIANTIEKFREKGGKFYRTEDLKRIYTITPELYAKIAPHILIPQSKNETVATYSEKATHLEKPQINIPININLNTANETELMTIRGIGKGYAKRILDRRGQLGGFYSIIQLKEIYNFPDSVYHALETIAIIDKKDIIKININSATEEQLAAHPYIGKQLAKNIIRLRTDMVFFKNIEDLKHSPLINEEKYRKIANYIYIE